MDDLRVGALIRGARRRRNLRQRDVAALAGVSQQTVSLIERGWLEKAGLRAVRAVARVLNVLLPFEPRLVGGDVHDVVDARHVAVVDAAIAKLPKDEWVVRLEYSFSRYGERGCVDILAWNARRRALLIIEAKSELADTQELLRTVDVRDRVLRSVVRQKLGWEPIAIASIVVLADDSTNRRRVTRYDAVLARALPARGSEVRDWIANPQGDLRGLLFVTVREERRVHRNPGRRGPRQATRFGRLAGCDGSARPIKVHLPLQVVVSTRQYGPRPPKGHFSTASPTGVVSGGSPAARATIRADTTTGTS